MRTTTQLIIFCVAVLVAPLTARQERVTTGPPPELRALVDAVTGAVLGGSPDAWESMARERFAPALLAKQTVAERRRIFDKLSVAFAGAKRGPVMRQGPDAPLELRMVGPSGPAGAIVLELTSGIPPRISGISIETAATPRPSDPEAPPPPPILPGMTKAELTAALDAYLRHLSDEGRLSGAALVARDTDVWFEGGTALPSVASAPPSRRRHSSRSAASTKRSSRRWSSRAATSPILWRPGSTSAPSTGIHAHGDRAARGAEETVTQRDPRRADSGLPAACEPRCDHRPIAEPHCWHCRFLRTGLQRNAEGSLSFE